MRIENRTMQCLVCGRSYAVVLSQDDDGEWCWSGECDCGMSGFFAGMDWDQWTSPDASQTPPLTPQ